MDDVYSVVYFDGWKDGSGRAIRKQMNVLAADEHDARRQAEQGMIENHGKALEIERIVMNNAGHDYVYNMTGPR